MVWLKLCVFYMFVHLLFFRNVTIGNFTVNVCYNLFIQF